MEIFRISAVIVICSEFLQFKLESNPFTLRFLHSHKIQCQITTRWSQFGFQQNQSEEWQASTQTPIAMSHLLTQWMLTICICTYLNGSHKKMTGSQKSPNCQSIQKFSQSIQAYRELLERMPSHNLCDWTMWLEIGETRHPKSSAECDSYWMYMNVSCLKLLMVTNPKKLSKTSGQIIPMNSIKCPKQLWDFRNHLPRHTKSKLPNSRPFPGHWELVHQVNQVPTSNNQVGKKKNIKD